MTADILHNDHGLDTRASQVETDPRNRINFVRVLPADLTEESRHEDLLAVGILNTMGYALNVVGWMAYNWEQAGGLLFEEHQQAVSKIVNIFGEIQLLHDVIYDSMFPERMEKVRRWVENEADERGRLPDELRKGLELIGVITRGENSLEQKKEFEEFVDYVGFLRCDQITAKIVQLIEKENLRFPQSTFDDFQALTEAHTLNVEQTLLGSIDHIEHDSAKILGMITGADRRSNEGLTVQQYLHRSWNALFNFIAHEARGYTEGIANQMMRPEYIAEHIRQVLDHNGIIGVEGEVTPIDIDIRGIQVLWADEDMVSLIRNFVSNAAHLREDMGGRRDGNIFKFTITMSKVDRLPSDAPEGKEDEGQGWLRLVIDDEGPGIGEHVANILGPDVFLSGAHGYQNGQETHGNGMAPQQRNIERRGGVIIVRNRVKDTLLGIDHTRDINDAREVIGARTEIYLPISPKY